MNHPELQQKTFLILLILVSIAFGWILLPFYGAVFWGAVLAILFAPFYRRLLARMHQRPNWAALTTLVICLIGIPAFVYALRNRARLFEPLRGHPAFMAGL